jgi:hypothetical protein
VGHRWATPLQKHVGALLPWRQRHSVRDLPLQSAFLVSSPSHLLPYPFLYFIRSHTMMMACRYVVDAADHEKFETTKKELHDLLSKPPLSRIPLLVVGNKNDLPEAVGQEQLTEILYENFRFRFDDFRFLRRDFAFCVIFVVVFFLIDFISFLL